MCKSTHAPPRPRPASLLQTNPTTHVETGGFHFVEFHMGSVGGSFAAIFILSLIVAVSILAYRYCQRNKRRSRREAFRADRHPMQAPPSYEYAAPVQQLQLQYQPSTEMASMPRRTPIYKPYRQNDLFANVPRETFVSRRVDASPPGHRTRAEVVADAASESGRIHAADNF